MKNSNRIYRIRMNGCKIKKMLTIIVLYSGFLPAFGQFAVTMEEKPLVIPTYGVAPPDKNPIFYTKRVYQGAQGHVYPLPLYDVLTDRKKDQTYNAVYLENDYVQLCVMPELGGRIFAATDKSDQYDFFYHQHVIKPSLIGMTGAWISGGVEWNIPDHHRATSNLPVDYTTEENTDGSKTVWIGETELSRGLKWSVGLTLYPGKSYIEATVNISNPTPFIHSFLYWANVSVHCDENYQVIFPPNTQFGAQHAKVEFTAWPVGTGKYGGLDRTSVDLSWWNNHPNPTSVFAWNFKDDFLAGYDFGRDAGTVHVANHHIVTGKKFFLWGNNNEARMWEKMLTDNDGQYLELMVGAYSDNQPDYSWIAPGETKTFKQYWYPIQKIQGVKKANTSAAVNLERKTPDTLMVGFCTTSSRKNATVLVTAGNEKLLEEQVAIGPSKPYLKELLINASVKETDLKATLLDSAGNELISYSAVLPKKEEMPEPVEKPKSPEEYKTTEELYLTGLRLDQFRNAVVDPMPYYQEALRRDSMDYRVNTILGIRFCREGRYSRAEEHLRKALSRITKNYTHPKTGEAFYYLGVVLACQNKLTDATDQFWKASWDAGFRSPACFRLAQLACREGRFDEALKFIDQSIEVNNLSASAWNLKAYALRKLKKYDAADSALKHVVALDKLNNGYAAESHFLKLHRQKQNGWTDQETAQFKKHAGSNVQEVLELVNNYGQAGAYDEAIRILDLFKSIGVEDSNFPMISYYAGFYHLQNGEREMAIRSFEDASGAPSDYCFPSRPEEIEILKTAIRENPEDAKAWYYLGDLHYYLDQKEQAINDWEQSVKLDDQFSYAWRNLGFAYHHVQNELEKSVAAYKKAISCNDRDPRFFTEMDEVMELAGIAPPERLSFLEKHKPVLEKHDDAIKRLVRLYNLTGAYNQALEILSNRHFHVWEGGGSIHDDFVDANLLQGILDMKEKKYDEALNRFETASTYPDHLEVGRPAYDYGSVQINYLTALAYEGMDQPDSASIHLKQAASREGRARRSEVNAYKAMALMKLGKTDEAQAILEEIREREAEQLKLRSENDFFAKFNVDNEKNSRQAFSYYLLGLADACEGNTQSAIRNFQRAVKLDQTQLWAEYLSHPENQRVLIHH